MSNSDPPPDRAEPPRFSLPRSTEIGLIVGLFFVYMLSGSRERPWADATPMYEVAERLVRDGSIAIRSAWPRDLPHGVGGKTYAVAPLFQSLMHVPGAFLRQAGVWLVPRSMSASLPFASHLGPSLLGALACLLFLRLCRRLRFGLGASVVATFMLAFATGMWIYARSPYAETLQAVAFTWLLLRTLDLRADPDRRNAVLAGVAAGVLVNAKLIYLVAVPGVLAWALYDLRKDPRRVGQLCGWFAAGFAPLFALILLYNHARWGSWLRAGYDLQVPVFVEHIGVGLWGLFLSPGKSVFLYSPPLVLSLVALPRAWRRMRGVLVLVLLAVVPVLLAYARFLFWSGDYAFGPRYLVFALPVLLLPGVLLLDDLLAAVRSGWRHAKLATVATVAGAGLCVQLLGCTLFWDHFIRISIEARADWLGWANKTGAPVKPEFDICGACFEDTHAIQWLPPFQPIEGHLWLLRHVLAGDDWKTATADAPWKRYTSLNLDIERSYARARIDWWGLDFSEKSREGVAVGLFAFMALGAAGGLYLFGRGIRRASG